MEESVKYKNLYNIEAEQIILGKIISNNDYFIKINEYLKEDFFYELAHRQIYKYVINTIQRATIVADSITLKNFFDNNEIISSIGGSSYLGTLLNISTGIFDIVSYAKLIQELAIKRNLILIGENLVTDVYNINNNKTAADQIESTEGKLFELTSNNELNKGFINLGTSLARTIDQIIIAKERDNHISGVSCKLIDLDKLLGGFQLSDLIILAGRPSMGKTTLAINLAYNAALFFQEETEITGQKKSVGFFSLEMPANQITSKILSIETGYNSDNFRKGEINEEALIEITKKAEIISNVPLFIDDTPALSINAIRTKTRRLIKQENLSFLVIDYLQLLHGVNESSKSNRVLEISEITQGLKAIAKEFNIPIIALSQLSRLVEHREDKKPQLSDLRESGSIEQDADVVIFIYRESYYEERKKPSDDQLDKMQIWIERMSRLRNKSEVIIAKHRNGPIGSVNLFFNAETSKFGDYFNERQL